MKILKISVVNEEVYVDGVGQGDFIGPKHAGLEDIMICRGIDIECEQIIVAVKNIMKKFNLPFIARIPLRWNIVVALVKARLEALQK